jgi:hypothetical protein
MSNIAEDYGIDKVLESRFANFMRRFEVAKLLRRIGAGKLKGVATAVVFSLLLGLSFTRKNFYELCRSERDNLGFGDDVVYRFLKKRSAHWEALVPGIAAQVIPEIDRLTSEARISAWVIDDSPYYRDRSKSVELLSRCKDHSENRYYKGFSLLAMGHTDGCTFIPADFRIVASGNDQNLLVGSQVAHDGRTRATKRRVEARTDKPALVLAMLDRAKATHPGTKHVLFDTWFSSPKAILDITAKDFHVVARVKNHENYRYLYDGEHLSLSQIWKRNKKRRGKSKYLLSVCVHVRHSDYDRTVPAKLVYVRNKNDRSRWIAILSTDMNLNEEEIIALYGKRWDIEPFFKFIKSALRLTKEFQMRSFDAIVAHTAIVLTRYIFVALESREERDWRSFGEIGMLLFEELEDISFREAFRLLMSFFERCLGECLYLAKDLVDAWASFFFDSLPPYIRGRLHFHVCES